MLWKLTRAPLGGYGRTQKTMSVELKLRLKVLKTARSMSRGLTPGMAPPSARKRSLLPRGDSLRLLPQCSKPTPI